MHEAVFIKKLQLQGLCHSPLLKSKDFWTSSSEHWFKMPILLLVQLVVRRRCYSGCVVGNAQMVEGRWSNTMNKPVCLERV